MIGDPLTIRQASLFFRIADGQEVAGEDPDALRELFAQGLIEEKRAVRNLYWTLTGDGMQTMARMLDATNLRRPFCSHPHFETGEGRMRCYGCGQLSLVFP